MTDQLLAVLNVALLALLYLFFARVLWAVWSEVRTPVPAEDARIRRGRGTATSTSTDDSTKKVRVKHAKGLPAAVVVEPRESRGQRFSVLENLTVGRADDNAVPMPDDTFISTHHATFQNREGALWIVDLNSTNGTFVNGQKVSGEKKLRSGDRVQLGSTVMEVH